MIQKIQNVLRQPSLILSYLGWAVRRVLVSRVVVSGQMFHKYRGELYPDYLNHGNASSFIRATALQWCTGKGLDIGAGNWPLPGSIPIRNEQEQNAYRLDSFEGASLDYIFSSHCLEHLEHWRDALRLWISKLKPEGTLFLYLPHESMKLWNPWGPWVASGHKWKPTIEVLLPFLRENKLEILDYNAGRDEYWSFHIVARRKGDEKTVPLIVDAGERSGDRRLQGQSF